MLPRLIEGEAWPITDRFLARGANVQLSRSVCERPWIAGAERVPVEGGNHHIAAARPGDDRELGE